MKETNFPYKNSYFERHSILLKTKLVFELTHTKEEQIVRWTLDF